NGLAVLVGFIARERLQVRFRSRLTRMLCPTKRSRAVKIEGSIEFTIVGQSTEKVVSEMPVTAGIKNPFAVAHAGAILWFADVTATVLVMGKVNASAGMQGFPLAIALNANFLSNQSEGSFKATSVFVK